jgi:hypothetical protein
MNKHILKIICCGALSLSLGACRSTNVTQAEPQVEMPEVAGRHLDVSIRADVVPARSIMPARGPSERPPNMNLRTEDTEQGNLNLGLDAGLGKNFEVGASGGMGASGAGCGGVVAKYQAYGSSRAAAKAGDLAVGVAAHGVGCRADFDGNSANYFDPGNSPWANTATSLTLDLGASVGYRLGDMFSVYGGVALAVTRAESIVNQDPSTGGYGSGGVFSSHINGAAQSVAIGGNWGGTRTWFDFKFNYAHSNADYINPDHFGVGLKLAVSL